ncbi:MAG: hypothetical protein ACXWL2_02590 [Candidatus Chromulinivorax sp.]
MKFFVKLLPVLIFFTSIHAMDEKTHGNLRIIKSEDGWNILEDEKYNSQQNSRSQSPKLPIDLENKEQELVTVVNPIVVEHRSANNSCEDLSKLEHEDYRQRKTINPHDTPRLSTILEQVYERKNASPKPEDIFKLPTLNDIFYFLPCMKKEKKY